MVSEKFWKTGVIYDKQDFSTFLLLLVQKSKLSVYDEIWYLN